MSTIAERAARAADKIKDPDGQRIVIVSYLIAAIEQRRVDIEKACEWLGKRLMYVQEDDNPHVEGTKIESLKEFLCDFRKAMEGEQ